MIKKKSNLLLFFTLLLDISFLLLAYTLSFFLRFYSGIFPVTKGIPAFTPYIYSTFFIILAYVIVFKSQDLYKKEKIPEEYYTIFKATLFVFFVFMTFTFLYREISYSRLFIAISFFVSFLFVSLGRAIINKLKQFFYRQGRFLTRVLLICEKKHEHLLKNKITPLDGYIVVQTLHDVHKKDLHTFIKQHRIHELIIHLPQAKHSDLAKLMDQGGYDVDYKIIPHQSDILTKKIIPEQIGSMTLLHIQETPLKGMNILIKRTIDFVLSFFFIILFSSLFILIAIFIKITSKGSIIYKQERVTYNKYSFTLYKFRTMISNAEQQTGPTWAANKDTRITRLGAFLRKTNLDELPQLFNVLKGDMSLIGPRPERPHFIKQFKHTVPHYMERHSIKSGMTGWAQVNGYYGNTSLKERINHDVFYIENWSLFFDIKILFRTIKLIFFRKH